MLFGSQPRLHNLKTTRDAEAIWTVVQNAVPRVTIQTIENYASVAKQDVEQGNAAVVTTS